MVCWYIKCETTARTQDYTSPIKRNMKKYLYVDCLPQKTVVRRHVYTVGVATHEKFDTQYGWCEKRFEVVILTVRRTLHNWSLLPISQDYGPSFSQHLCCVC